MTYVKSLRPLLENVCTLHSCLLVPNLLNLKLGRQLIEQLRDMYRKLLKQT